MSAPSFRFDISDHIRGSVSPVTADRVGLYMNGANSLTILLTMSATDARAFANALYEAADASEKVLPVKPDAAVAA